MLGVISFPSISQNSRICNSLWEVTSYCLPYTEYYFKELLTTGKIEKIEPSPVWYDSRSDFSSNAIGTITSSHQNEG